MADRSRGRQAQPDFEDPRWFPVDLHVAGRRYGFLRLDEDVLERESFLDTRMQVAWGDALPFAADAIPALAPQPPPAWLFHTSFCGSTLLARALHLPPYQVCLREPLLLRRLGDARHDGVAVDVLLPQVLSLLARPWHPGGRVLVKPTHVALNLADSLMTASPASRAIVLTSSLEDFLVSNLKKTAETQAKIPALAERALHASGFGARLTATALQPPDPVCAAGLQWAAQRELIFDLARRHRERLHVIDMQALLDDVEVAVVDCARRLQLAAPEAELAAHARTVATRNAKAIGTAYSPLRRHEESALVIRHYRDALDRARAWLDEHVLAAMHPAAAKSLPGTLP